MTLACQQSKQFLRRDGVRGVYGPIAEHTQLFEHHFCDLRIAPVNRHLLVVAHMLSNLASILHDARLGVNKVEAVDNFSALNQFAPKMQTFLFRKAREQLRYDGGIEPSCA